MSGDREHLFRDPGGAALERAVRLEEENAQLRAELANERSRRQAQTVRTVRQGLSPAGIAFVAFGIAVAVALIGAGTTMMLVGRRPSRSSAAPVVAATGIATATATSGVSVGVTVGAAVGATPGTPTATATVVVGGGATATAFAAAPASAATPSIAGSSFDRAAAVVALGAVDVAPCKQEGGPTGPGHVRVTFAPSGAVAAAEVDSGAFVGTAVGACVASRFAAVQIPPFSAPAVTVGKAFSLP